LGILAFLPGYWLWQFFPARVLPASPTSTHLPTGAVTEDQPDGSTLFTDYDNQYQLTLPKG
jgi:hypothetical protein